MPADQSLVVGREQPTHRRLQPEDGKEGSGHELPGHLLGAAVVADVHRPRHPAEHPREHLVAIAKVAVDRVRQLGVVAHASAKGLGVRRAHLHHPARRD